LLENQPSLQILWPAHFCNVPLAVSSIPTAFPSFNPKERAVKRRWNLSRRVTLKGSHPRHAYLVESIESVVYSPFSSTLQFAWASGLSRTPNIWVAFFSATNSYFFFEMWEVGGCRAIFFLFFFRPIPRSSPERGEEVIRKDILEFFYSDIIQHSN
jgi:hypothetical protein